MKATLSNSDPETKDHLANCERATKAFVKPTLTFIEPKLTKQRDATKITKQHVGFFGTFTP